MREKNICVLGWHGRYFLSISITNLNPNGWALNRGLGGAKRLETRILFFNSFVLFITIYILEYYPICSIFFHHISIPRSQHTLYPLLSYSTLVIGILWKVTAPTPSLPLPTEDTWPKTRLSIVNSVANSLMFLISRRIFIGTSTGRSALL